MSSDVIRAEGLTKRFGELVAVDHVTFTVSKGEVFGFLGPNGAGKTTTIRMLIGILRPDEGKAKVLGLDVEKNGLEVRNRIGVVPEASNVYPDLTVWQNLMFMAELYMVPKRVREERATNLLKKLGLERFRDVRAGRLSKGLRQRLLLCTALIHEPELLFLDEPTSGLDIQSAHEIRRMLKEMNGERGVTIFLTTHNLQEAEEMCDRIGIINRGKLITISTPTELKEKFAGLRCVEVVFEKDVNPGELSKALGCEVEKRGRALRLYVEDVNECVCKVVDYSKRSNIRIASLNVVQPSLEEAFLRVIGS